MQTQNAIAIATILHEFHAICQIPRPSGAENAILSYIEGVAQLADARYERDSIGNLWVYKEASDGFAKHASIAWQAHVDMVCQAIDPNFDFTHQAIEYHIDGDWMIADATTLGADNGIGVAIMLYLIQQNDLPHPAFEFLFTVDEEVNLSGATHLAPNKLKSAWMLNLDCEDFGHMYVGSAGGEDLLFEKNYSLVETQTSEIGFSIHLHGFLGGHSGGDIHLNRGSACECFAQILGALSQEFSFKISAFNAGNLANAIARSGSVHLVIDESIKVPFCTTFKQAFAQYLEAHLEDAMIQCDIQNEVIPTALSPQDTQDLISFITQLPHGVLQWHPQFKQKVVTSNNLAIINLDHNHAHIRVFPRSSDNQELEDLMLGMISLGQVFEFHSKRWGAFPAWQPQLDSALIDALQHSYQVITHKPAELELVHAGLECGLILEAYPDLHIISIGPTILGAHAPGERLQISTLHTLWQVLAHFIQNLAVTTKSH